MKPPERGTTTLETEVLQKPPCCMELHPTRRDILVIGTYELAEDDALNDSHAEVQHQRRDGSLVLYQIVENRLHEIQTLHFRFGILDVHWQKQQDDSIRVGAVTSSGSLVLCNCEVAQCRLFLTHTHTLQLCETKDLITAFVWSPYSNHEIAFTVSTGSVMIFSAMPRLERTAVLPINVDHKQQVVRIFQHQLEAWTLAFLDCGSLLSGGDDAVLQRTPLRDASDTSSRWAYHRPDRAGVISILPLWDDYIAIGHYDDHVRVIDSSKGPRDKSDALVELNLGGGVWRLSNASDHHSTEDRCLRRRILACCMYAGACVIDVTMDSLGNWQIDLVAKYTEHESMCYGGLALRSSDVSADVEVGEKARSEGRGCHRGGHEELYITCSFYDRRLCLWTS